MRWPNAAGQRRWPILACVNLYFASSFASIDSAIIKIDLFDHSALAWEIDYAGTGAFGEAMAHFWTKLLVVAESHDQIGNFNRRVFNLELNLSEPAFVKSQFDAVVVVSEVYVARP